MLLVNYHGHKDGLDYVPYDNYIARLHKGERVLTKEENKEYTQADKVFNMPRLVNSNELFKKIEATVNYETSKLSANLTSKATLQLTKDQPKTVTSYTDKGVNVTQNFYDKQATPYEQQKQAKQQMRRLAYGL